MDLEKLINECKKNDRKAQEQLYKEYSSKLFSVCLKYSRNYTEAQDNLQEVFLLVFKKINQFGFKGSFDGWLKRVTVNYVLQQYRTETKLHLVTEVADEIEEVEIEIETVSLEFLLKIIQELPDRYRMVFNLNVIDGFSHQEIAEMLDITIGTSKSNLHRAKAILKDKIETNSGTSKVPQSK
ncbi:MAG: RNA polymerase sigma factor (sigma-70 family) [Flavobacterium sp.]